MRFSIYPHRFRAFQRESRHFQGICGGFAPCGPHSKRKKAEQEKTKLELYECLIFI